MDETSWRRTGQRYGQHNQPPMTNHIVCVWFFCVSLIIHAAQWITRIKSVERFFFAIEFSLLFFFVLFYFICLLVALDEPNLFENNRDSALKSHYSLTHQLRTDEIMACSTSSFSCRNFLKEKAEKSRRCDGHRNQLRYFLWGVYTFWLHIYVCVSWTLVIPFPSTCLPILRLRAARRAQYARGNGSGWALLGALIYIISFFSRSWWSMCVLG